jgi:outer membrane protein TolC
MRKTPIILIMLCFMRGSLAAEEYSLGRCIEHARRHNGGMKIVSLNAEISARQVRQRIGDALPKVDVTGSLLDNVELTTTLLPGEFLGMPSGTYIPVRMGTRYNSTVGVRLSQTIFEPSVWVGLKAAKLSERLSNQKIRQTDEELCYGVSAAYYQAFVLRKKFENLSAMLEASRRTLDAAEMRYQNGVAERIDVDRVRVSCNNTRSQVEESELNLAQAMNRLKYLMGMPMEEDLALSDTLSENVWETPGESPLNDEIMARRVDYQMLQIQVAAQQLNRQNQMAAFLPTITFSASGSYQAMRTRFDIFEKDGNWYRNASVGLNLAIPVFSGLSRVSKVSEAGLAVEAARENLRESARAIELELSDFSVQYSAALNAIRDQKDNLSLAESVLDNTRLKFAQGAGSSIDLIQAESAFRETQNNYYARLLSLTMARLNLEKSRGALIPFINNIR